jgi:hypothetical protein
MHKYDSQLPTLYSRLTLTQTLSPKAIIYNGTIN